MSYASAVEHLYALGHELASPMAPRRKFRLEHMRSLARALGDPQNGFSSVLIAGTNGKGSTAATLASICRAAGYCTALYTSPHLARINERIQIDGLAISDGDFARLYDQVDAAAQRLVRAGELPHLPSFFETLTAMAFLAFKERAVEIAVLEVGMGGRLDATNIVEPLLSIITDISLDHQNYLGNTIAEIAHEKAGILRPGGILVTLPQHPEANRVIGEAASELNVQAISAAQWVPSSISSQNNLGAPFKRGTIAHEWDTNMPALPRNRYTVLVEGQPIAVDSPLRGQHQQRNIALAVAAADLLSNIESYNTEKSNHMGYNISSQQIEEGIRNTIWPGRLELLRLPGGPGLLLDVAHNPAGAWTLRAAVAQLPESQPRTLIFSCLRDKDLREMARILLPLFDATAERPRDHVLFAPIHNARAATLDELTAAASALEIPARAMASVAAALAEARRVTAAEGVIVATGSIYLIGELRNLALSQGWETAT
ncbi:MAG: bifunctional folylpolyglutamate synthase/dihydrofolate synthase [Acidobacteriaceae bacterium]|nr:bifunctional folylpolyglutamate synthase/dihydrofolate synthase [Acidobacteriaceae bacterium]